MVVQSAVSSKIPRVNGELGSSAEYHVIPSHNSPFLQMVNQCKCIRKFFFRITWNPIKKSVFNYVRFTSLQLHSLLNGCTCKITSAKRLYFSVSSFEVRLTNFTTQICSLQADAVNITIRHLCWEQNACQSSFHSEYTLSLGFRKFIGWGHH